MIGLLGTCHSWTRCLRSDGRQCAAPSRSTAGAGTQTYDHLGGTHSDPPRAARRNRLLHCRGSDVARAGDLLRFVLHSSREPPCGRRRHHCASRRAMDGADRPQRDHGWDGVSCVAVTISCMTNDRISSHRHLTSARPQPKFERPRGTVGTLSHGRVSVEDCSLWGATPPAGDERRFGALSYRAKSPR
jgi:hypothetical protein